MQMLNILILQRVLSGINTFGQNMINMTRFINYLLLVLLALSTLAIAENTHAPSCGDVSLAVSPCLLFLKGGGNPSSECCAGAKGLEKQAQTKADREAICECLKTTLSKVGPYDPIRVPAIAEKCDVDMTIPPITSGTDCSKA